MINWDTVKFSLTLAVALVGWIAMWRKAAMAEGKHKEEVEQLKQGLDRAFRKIGDIECSAKVTDSAVVEIKTDLRWIKEALSDIKATLAEAK